MKKLLSLTAVAFLGLLGHAHATVLDFDLGNASGVFSFVGDGPALNPNIDLSTYSGLTHNSNATLISEGVSVANQYKAPNGGGSLFGGDYLVAFGAHRPPNHSGQEGLATFTLAPTINEFSFTWGTIDSYNKLMLTDSNGHVFNITGNVFNNPSLISGFKFGTTEADVRFFDPFGSITSAVLTSSDNSFEAANFGAVDPPAPVPLPGSIVMYVTALIAFMCFVTWRKLRPEA